MRVVIKVGTSLIAPGGQIDIHLLRGIVDQFDLSKNEYLIVTSGAIAAGMSGLALAKRPGDVPRMQACAAVGQSKLMHTYERLFFGKKIVAQLLLSSDDFTSPVRYRNLQNALAQLLALGVVPIVNENDSVSVRELEGAFGDNDELSSLLATAVKADWLLLLTDVDGFLDSERPQKAAPAASDPPIDSGAGSSVQRQEFTRPWWHGFKTPRRKASQRGRSACRHRERPPSAGDFDGNGAQDRNLLSAAQDKLMSTTVNNAISTHDKLTRARAAASTLALLSTHEKDAILLAIANAVEKHEKEILMANSEDVASSGLEGAMRDRLLLTSCAHQRHGPRSSRDRSIARSHRRNARGLDQIQWPAHPQSPRAFRGHWHRLRIAAKRHG